MNLRLKLSITLITAWGLFTNVSVAANNQVARQPAANLTSIVNNQPLLKIALSSKYLKAPCSSNNLQSVIKFVKRRLNWPGHHSLKICPGSH